MKRITLLTSSLLAATIFAGPVSAKEITVGLSWNSKTQPLESAWEDYMKAEGERQGKEAGVTINWVVNVANADPARQTANIEDLINKGVNVVVARAEDGAAIGASIRAAKAASIPFITFDRASKDVKPDAHVGGDSYDQAVTTGDTFLVLLKEKGVTGKCIELQGALTDVNAINRSKGWNEVVARSGGVLSTIVQVPTEWNPELFRSGMANALKAHPEANCAFIASDFAITAVQSAMEAEGKWAPAGDPKHVWLATQDLLPGAVPLMEQGYIDVATTYDAFAHASEAVRVIIALADGKDPGCGPDGCLAKGRVATPDNVKTMENLWSRTYK